MTARNVNPDIGVQCLIPRTRRCFAEFHRSDVTVSFSARIGGHVEPGRVGETTPTTIPNRSNRAVSHGVSVYNQGETKVGNSWFNFAKEIHGSWMQHRGPKQEQIEMLRTLCNQGRYPEAADFACSITGRFPDYGFGWRALGELLLLTGQPFAALAAMRKAADLLPDDAQLHCQLGFALEKHGRLAEAEASYRRALQLYPALVDVRNDLGNVLFALRRFSEAEESYQQALQLKPDFVEVHHNLGNLLRAQNRLAEAEASYQRALQLRPDYAAAHGNLGSVYVALGRLSDAETSLRRAVQLDSSLADAHNQLATTLRAGSRLTEAETSLRRAVQLNPGAASYHNNLGNVLLALGRISEAESSYERALQIRPQYPQAYSNLLLSLNYLTDRTADAVFAKHREYADRFAAPHRCERLAQSNWSKSLTSDRRLKVAYISPDFREHSVAYFISPLLREHNREAVEVFCYSDVAKTDAATASLHELADHWLGTVTLSDAELAERIRADEIDILVDLAGHTAGNRLDVFARQPAPIQISWLGYPNTTGLDAIGYRLVDAVTDPPGQADRWASETLIRLDDGFLCYQAPADARLPDAPPCLAGGKITFASFNNPAKLSAVTLAAWGRLLERVPRSRLLLKGRGFTEEATRQSLLARFAETGGDPQRVTLLAPVDGIADHLAFYGQVDIALDPFPYNGTTTTCEALWMGVPIVTLAGDRHAGRVGASLLTQVGLTDLIASSVDGYVEVAASLAADRHRLARLRQTMRERMRASSLCDAPRFARKIESAYRAAWQQYCLEAAADQSGGSGHILEVGAVRQ